ncbi:MAG: hypothetical protein QOJ69_2206, partial [Actinomycetota bacterium]|nr:hypothetical protein [Actinomycetota bacterium]
KPKVGAPSAEQLEARKQAADPEAAADLVALQKDLAATRKLVVVRARNVAAMAPGGGYMPKVYKDITFNPVGPPTEKNDTEAPDQPKQTWEEVKKAYDAGVEAIREITSLHPTLYVLVRDQYEDSSKTAAVADDKSPDRFGGAGVVGEGLAETLANIGKVRPMMGKTIAKDLDPIHRQLRAGTVTSAGSQRNWASDPVWKPLADAYVEASKPGPWWEALGLAALEMGAFVIAGLATGGIGFAAAMAVKGAGEAAVAYGKQQVYSAAAGSSASADTSLMTGEQARQAKAEAAMAAAFALLDALQLGAEVKGALAASKMAGTAGAEAQKAIETSEKVLQYEKSLLGTVSKVDAENAVKEAERLAAEATGHAKKARQAAETATGAEKAGAEARARLAEKAAERANKAKDRLKDTAGAYARAADAAEKAVPEKDLAPTVTEVLPDGAGKIIVTKAGLVFHCASPCADVLAKYADVVARHPELKAKAAVYDQAYADAKKALAAKGAPTEAIEKRISKAAGLLAIECQKYKKAEVIVKWLRGEALVTYPKLKGVVLDEAAVVRIISKGKRVDAVKGQLFEELTASDIRRILRTGTPEEKARLAGEHAGEALEFIPGHMLRTPDGRQLTDGIVGFKRPDGKFQIVTIVEVKAGVNAAQGLRLGEMEIRALQSAKFNQWTSLRNAGDHAGSAKVRQMSLQQFADAHPDLVETAMKKKLGTEGDWRTKPITGKAVEADWERQAIETVQAEHADELRAMGQTKGPEGADAVGRMTNSQYKAKYPDRTEKAKELLPLPEAGQFTRDLERRGQIGVEKLDPTHLPPMGIDGPNGGPVLNPKWKSVPKGEWGKMEVAGGRGKARMHGRVSSDVDEKALTSAMGDEGLQGTVEKGPLSGEDLDKLATELVERASREPASQPPG